MQIITRPITEQNWKIILYTLILIFYGLDGTKDVSGSGVAYLTVRPLEYKNLSGALVGAFGDMQYKNGFSGVNKTILDDGIESGNIEVRDDLK